LTDHHHHAASAPAPAAAPDPSALAPRAPDRSRLVFIETMGCQMNVYDSERMLDALGRGGYGVTDRPDGADLIIVNTCSVREKSEHKMISLLGKLRALKEHNPELVLAVAGCVATQEGERLLRRAPHLDLVLGPDQTGRVAELVAAVRDGRAAGAGQQVDVALVGRKGYRFVQPEPPADGRVTSFVTVMKGCNKICTFCIVPATRGREVSKPRAEVLAEVRMLAEHGVREVTLLGQNVNSYGHDRAEEVEFAELLAAVAEVPGIARVRFTTSHPMDCSDALIDAFAQVPALMPWFHLPIQSGSEAVLRRMRRPTEIADYISRIERLRLARPEIAMTTDVIVGFPGEGEEDFEATMALLRRVRFASIYAFAYSPRPGTRAAAMADDIPEPVKRARLHAVQALQAELTASWMASFAEREVEVLFEGASTAHLRGPEAHGATARVGLRPQLMGRTPENLKVNVETDDFYALRDWPGRLGRVRVTHVGKHSLSGSLLALAPPGPFAEAALRARVAA
jgi:tRNA-2-methylthio-N6-dimethylallyladenosine synthase